VQKRLSVEERPFMAALRQCKRMSPFRAEAYKAKSIEFLDAALKSRSSTVAVGATSVGRKKHCANPEGSRVSPFRGIADWICGRAAIHGRVERD